MTDAWKHILGRILRWTGGIVGALVLMVAALLWTPPGHRLLAWTIDKATDGQVIVTGLSGMLPEEVFVQRVELRDAQGTWLRIMDAQLHWSLLPILGNHIVVHSVAAAKVELLRRPLPAASSEGATPRIDLDVLSLPHIDIAPSLIGYPAMLAARGSLHFVSRHQLQVDLAVTRPGGGDRYTVKGGIADDVANGTAVIVESPDGLMGKIAGLPGLGAIHLSAQASGDRAANRMAFQLAAGVFRANGQGTVSLADARADLDFSATAPAMQLRDDLGWASLTADGHLHGAFAAPDVKADFHVTKLRGAGLGIAEVSALASGQTGSVDVTATANGVQLPGTYAQLFARAPVMAKLHVDLAGAGRPVTFSLQHPLASLDGKARTAGDQSVSAHVVVPSLAPFAALVKADLQGAAQLQVEAAKAGPNITLAMTGGLQARGNALIARMLGTNATLAFRTTMAGTDMLQSHIRFRGAGFDTDVTGGSRAGRLDYRISAALLDLSRLTPTLTGAVKLSGTVSGPIATALVDLSGKADMASRGFARQRLDLGLHTTGLPSPQTARVTASGRLDGAGLNLVANWSPRGKDHDAKLAFDWKSLAAKGTFTVPKKGPITGHAVLDAANIGDIASFTGMAFSGRLHVGGDLNLQGGHQRAVLMVKAGGLHLANATIADLNAGGTIVDPLAVPNIQIGLEAKGLSANGFTGAVSAKLAGRTDNLAVTASASLKDDTAQPLTFDVAAVANALKSQVQVNSMTASWRDQTAILAAPARFDLADGIAVDHLAVKAGGGGIAMAGRLTPHLAMTASADGIQASVLKTFMPQLLMDGTLSAAADLHGTLTAPLGTVNLHGHGLRARGYSSRLAPADLVADAQLQGGTAQVDVKLAAGSMGMLTLRGDVPLSPNGFLDLHAKGSADLAILNPLLAVDARQVKGQLTLDGGVAGTLAAPRVTGSAGLRGVELQDYARGLRVQDVTADFTAANNVIQIVRFSGRAGPGTIDGSGTVDIAGPGLPIALVINAHDARPIVSDRMTASLSGDLKLAGKLAGAMTLSGKLRIPRAELTLPDSFPPDVRTLNIRRRGQPPPGPPPATTSVALDLSVETVGPITVRGHGVDADLGGNLRLSGSTGAPVVAGGFEMQRGTLSVAGQTLSFTTGKVSFDGTGVRNRLDPTLNFVAQETSGGVTATLTVTGYASAPRIALTSSPQLPQDEVLAHLLFQQSSTQLSPLQLAQIAQALASLSGIGGGFDPVASLRGGLGLDRLAVGSGNGVTSGATVEAGKYVARNVYVGAKQGLSGGTQAQVQVDITRNLKAQATISTGANATATQGSSAQDNGSNVGLSYQFEY